MQAQGKIREIRLAKKLSRRELYEKLRDIFGAKALKPNSIWRIEEGLTQARASSLHQICVGLGVSLKEVLGEVKEETGLASVIKKDKRMDEYVYNRKARAAILTPRNMRFLAEEMLLAPGGVTTIEENPIEVGKFEKWVYCLAGKITCVVGTEKHTLNKGDCLSFASNLPHHFENNSSQKTKAIIVQNPRYI